MRTHKTSLIFSAVAATALFSAAAMFSPAIALVADPGLRLAQTQEQAEPVRELTPDDIAPQEIDPIITGETSQAGSQNDWQERHGERKRCNFCTGYQPYPGD